MMTLTELKAYPPGGYSYFEPEINWRCPKDIALIGLNDAARALQVARANNPWAGLDPSFVACRQAIMDYTCKRLNYDPKFCGPQPVSALNADNSRAQRVGCAGCLR